MIVLHGVLFYGESASSCSICIHCVEFTLSEYSCFSWFCCFNVKYVMSSLETEVQSTKRSFRGGGLKLIFAFLKKTHFYVK